MQTTELAKNPVTAEFCTDVTDIIMEVISRNSGLIGLEAGPPTNDPDPIVVSAMPFSPEEVVDKSPEKWGWFASIGYAFWHLMETLESIKEKILRKQAPENLSNGEKETSSDRDEVHNHSKSSFESIKNIFALIPYFGSFFSTRNEIKKKTNEIIKALKNQDIPRIPHEILPHLSDQDLREIQGRLFMQCNKWEDNRDCPETGREDLDKCNAELSARQKALRVAAEQMAAEQNAKLSGEEEEEEEEEEEWPD